MRVQQQIKSPGILMAKMSIIERIAAERKKRRRQQIKAKSKKSIHDVSGSDLSVAELERLKAELEKKIKASKQRADQTGDESVLAAIKAQLDAKKQSVSAPMGELKPLEVLVENGTQEDWLVFIGQNLKTETKMEFPPIESQKCKFPEYGYRRLVEFIIESEDFLKLIIEIKDVSGFSIVSLNHLIRGDDPTLRGIEALCNLLINHEIRYNPVCETDFKYLNVLLDSLTIPQKDGINRVWELKIGDKNYEISASFDKAAQEWLYKFSKP